MAFFEKVEKYEDELRKKLDLVGYTKIINLMLTFDTGQANVQLLDEEKKHNMRSTVLSQGTFIKIKDLVLREIYPEFLSKQVINGLIEKESKEIEEIDISVKEKNIMSDAEEKEISARIKAEEASRELSSLSPKEAVLKRKEIEKSLFDELNSISEDSEKEIQAEKEKEEKKINKKYEKLKTEVLQDYGIATVKTSKKSNS